MTLDRRQLVAGALAAGMAAGSARAATAPWTAEGVVRRPGGVLHWASVGEGPPVVLMPKLGGWIADWRHVAPLLARHFRVIAIDPPGHGGSIMASPPPRVQTLAESAAWVRAALAELGVERFSFAGNSLGGLIGTTMAVLFPKDVERLALVSVALGTRATPEEVKAHQDGLVRNYTADGRPIPRGFEAAAARFGLTPELNDEQNLSRAQAGQWIIPSERGVLAAGTLDHLPRIEAPTLLVYGDSAFYTVYRENALKALRDGRAVTIEGSGAFTHQQKPAETAAVLTDFFLGKA